MEESNGHHWRIGISTSALAVRKKGEQGDGWAHAEHPIRTRNTSQLLDALRPQDLAWQTPL